MKKNYQRPTMCVVTIKRKQLILQTSVDPFPKEGEDETGG